MAAVSGKVARIRVTAAAATSSTDNAATLSTSGLVLSIDSTSRRHWNRASSTHVVVWEGAVDRSTDITDINYVQGTVTFDTAHSTGSSWTIDVEYLTSSYLGQGRNWSADIGTDMLDTTAFSTTTSDAQWRTFTPGISEASVSIDRFWGETTGPAFFDRLAAGQDTVVELWQDSGTRAKLEGFAYVSGDGFNVNYDSLTDESVSLDIDGQLYYSTN